MLETIKQHPGAVIAAIAFHVFIGLLFIVGFNWTEKPGVAGNPVPVKIVLPQTVAEQTGVDLPHLEATLQQHERELEKLQQQSALPSPMKPLTSRQVDTLHDQEKTPQKKAIQQAKKQQQVRQAEEEKARKRKAAQTRQAKAKARKKAAEEKARKLAREKARKKAREKKITEKRKAEKRKAEKKARKLAQERKKRKARELEKKKAERAAQKAQEEQAQAAREAREKQEQARKQQEALAREAAAKKAEQERQQGMAALAAAAKARRDAQKQAQQEAAARQAAEQKAQQARAQRLAKARETALGNWGRKIVRHVRPRWQTPPGSGGMTARVKVKVSRSGYIRQLTILNCKGTRSFCDSIRAAFKRAEPLPGPSRHDLFDENLNLTFKR